jgi:hypothetical protein
MTGSFGLRSLWLVLGLTLVLPVASARADSGEEEAHKHFKVGISYLQDPEGERFEEAYGEFKLAYDLSHSPKVLGNIGLCAMKLERDGEAINAYTRYLQEVPDIEADERTQIERDLAALQASAVHVSVTVRQANASLSDTHYPAQGANVLNVYSPTQGANEYLIRPGHHVITLRIDARDVASWEFTASPGSKLARDFSQASAPGANPAGNGASAASRSQPSRTVPFIVTGVGVAALAAGGVFGLVTLGKVHDLDKKCPNDTCPSNAYSADVDPVRNYVRTTDVLLIGGGVVTAAGITWLLLSGPSQSERVGRANDTRIGAMCTNKACAGTLRMAF